MIEQWFLDLDGVRSGPYQTPEVMSLIAEGEVLPHHRISTSLREQRWITILDWRLDQAKISQKIPSPYSTSRSEVSSVEGVSYEAPPAKPEAPATQWRVDPTVQRTQTQTPAPQAYPPNLNSNPIQTPKAEAPKQPAPPTQKSVNLPKNFQVIENHHEDTHDETDEDDTSHEGEVEASMDLPIEETPGFSKTELSPKKETPASPSTPAREIPSREAPSKETPARDASVPKMSTDETPSRETVLRETEPQKISAPDHTRHETSARETGTRETLAREMMGKENAPRATTPVEEVPFEESEEVIETSAPKRDPMAEMFDMLQNTKQRRQARQNHEASAGISIEHDIEPPPAKTTFSFGRTLFIGLGISLVGFAIGQVFQQHTQPNITPPAPTAATAKISKTSASQPQEGGATVSTDNPPGGDTQVIDRSTDKMTIKGYVAKDAQGTAGAKTAKGGATVGPETPQTEKELEELRNLKKELQELKNLKSNGDETPDANDGQPEQNPGVDPNGNPPALDPNTPNGPGTTTAPSEGGAQQLNNPNGDGQNR